MASLSNIGRPYALAAFEYARDKHDLAAWKAFLESASYVAKQSSVVKLLTNPQVAADKLFELFHDVLAPLIDPARKNFLSLLVQNKRLLALPEVADLFNIQYAAFEKISSVRIVTAIDMDDTFRQKISQALTKRVQREITLHCEVDPSILGGAIIHIGDRVIDGSIRGKLTRLLEFSLR